MPLQPIILQFDTLPSTNTEAAQQAKRGGAEGLCVIAREQTAGRGRQDRAWSSPRDAGLYFSIVLRPQLEMSQWPLLTLAAALAVVDALAEACAVGRDGLDFKWPNDVYAGGRKLCGILAETFETNQGRACVVGIGINLMKDAFSPELQASATSIEELMGRRADREVLLRALVRGLERRYDQWHNGAGDIAREWTANSSYAAGKQVRVSLDGEIIEGTTRGLEPDGALRVETFDGKIMTVRAGDVLAIRAREISDRDTEAQRKDEAGKGWRDSSQ